MLSVLRGDADFLRVPGQRVRGRAVRGERAQAPGESRWACLRLRWVLGAGVMKGHVVFYLAACERGWGCGRD
eukprot:8772710-Alexandrium_andersonii.AAC.1